MILEFKRYDKEYGYVPQSLVWSKRWRWQSRDQWQECPDPQTLGQKPSTQSMVSSLKWGHCDPIHGPLTRYVQLRPECRERFPRRRLQRKPLVSDPGMHHGTCVTHVGITNPRWRGKHSRHMRNPQVYVSCPYLARYPWLSNRV